MQTAATVTHFANPFVFFCAAEETDDENKRQLLLLESIHPSRMVAKTIEISSLAHGQYIAVYWMEKWVRGIVSMENLVLVWLVDHGIYLRPQEKFQCIPLPPEFKKIPARIYEASIHGVMPIDKGMDDECQIRDVVSTSWNAGAIDKAKNLIESAIKISFVPVGLLSTKHNDIVLGDLYLDLPRKGFVNIIDELEQWPVFLQKNAGDFVKNLPVLFKTRRHHYACPVKPNIPGLAPFSLTTTLQEYNTIFSAVQPEYTKQCEPIIEDGSTVIGENGRDIKPKKPTCFLSPDELEEFANLNVVICGQQYNMLHLLVSKARDFDMCQRYQDHDLKGWGRGCSSRSDSFFYD